MYSLKILVIEVLLGMSHIECNSMHITQNIASRICNKTTILGSRVDRTDGLLWTGTILAISFVLHNIALWPDTAYIITL